QVNLERMLSRMGGVEHFDQLGRDQALDQGAVDRHAAQRGLPAIGRGCRQAVKADKVRWAEQDDAGYPLPSRGEPAIAGRSNASAIDVTGMRQDQHFRYRSGRTSFGSAEELGDFSAEFGGRCRVEQSSDSGGADGGQG